MVYEGIPKGQVEYFNNKNILVIVPHQDDEINLAGGILYWLYQTKAQITVLYTTNGNYRGKGKKRIQEAINSVITLGGKKEDIIFLGYSDQAVKGETHLYTSEGIWSDRHGRNETYIDGEEEFCYKQHKIHRQQNRSNFIKDIKEVLELKYPDIIYCVDFDSHPDHRAASLGFEYALGEILKENQYSPIVFKTFAYPLTYKGKEDFYNSWLKSTKYNPEEMAGERFQNPYYKWEERVRFALLPPVRNIFLPHNILYQALRCHKSQNITEHADRIINNDQVAWLRRTDSVLYDAKIRATSGDISFLNDFVLFDCSNIMNGNKDKVVFDKGVWIPEITDLEPVITIDLKNKSLVNELIIYRNVIDSMGIRKIEIDFDDDEKEIYYDEKNELVWHIRFRDRLVKRITIRIVDTRLAEAGITEIELFYTNEAKELWSFPTDNDDLVYPDKEKIEKYSNGIYTFNGYIGEIKKLKKDYYVKKKCKKCRIIFLFDRALLLENRIYHSLRRRIQKLFHSY